MDDVNFNRLRTQLNTIHQDFVDFVYKEEKGDEIILVKNIKKWLQVGHSPEYNILSYLV